MEETTVSSRPFYCVPGQLAREALNLAHSTITTLLLPARNGSFSIDNIHTHLFCRPFCLGLTLRVFLQISFRKSNKQYVGFKRYIGLGRPKKINEMYIIRRKRRTNFPKNNQRYVLLIRDRRVLLSAPNSGKAPSSGKNPASQIFHYSESVLYFHSSMNYSVWLSEFQLKYRLI